MRSFGVALTSGAMRQVVTIASQTTSQDAAGEPLVVWLVFATVRAEVQRLAGREAFASQQRQGFVPTIFRLRFIDGVLPKMRLTCGSKLYDIVSAVDPDGMRAETILTCLEQVDKAIE